MEEPIRSVTRMVKQRRPWDERTREKIKVGRLMSLLHECAFGKREPRAVPTSRNSATWAGLPRGDQATLTSASVSAPMAPSFFPRRLCRPTCRAHRARGGWNHSRRCPVTRPPECRDCPVDICPVDIFAQRQHVWIARPTLKAIDQEQSLATVHHAIAGSPAARSPPLPMSR
jgi:hypothetical protein